jgi:hypothetical protein
MGGVAPFQSGDAWTVFPDGRVAIVRAADFHVDLITPDGRKVSGAPFRYTPVRITEAEKEEWRASRRNATMVSVQNNNGNVQRSVQSGAGATVQDPETWPATKSPFSTEAVWSAPNGDTWVFHNRAARDRVPVAEVFNARGQLIGKVVLPERTRLVGFGAKSVYLARSDDDDLQYLQRHAIAWTGCAPEMREVC